MNVCLNGDGQVDCRGMDGQTTVQDLLDAVDRFLAEHPLPCDRCAESCCKKHWAVEVDNVAARRLAGEGNVAAFVRSRLKTKWNYALDFRQYVLRKQGACPFVSQENRCSVYAARPLICRLYVCSPRSERYDSLRGAVAATYLQALVFEQNMREKQLSEKTLRKYRRNPALGAIEYRLTLSEIIKYGYRMGWVDGPEEAIQAACQSPSPTSTSSKEAEAATHITSPDKTFQI